jgi:hypothetical protein
VPGEKSGDKHTFVASLEYPREGEMAVLPSQTKDLVAHHGVGVPRRREGRLQFRLDGQGHVLAAVPVASDIPVAVDEDHRDAGIEELGDVVGVASENVAVGKVAYCFHSCKHFSSEEIKTTMSK